VKKPAASKLFVEDAAFLDDVFDHSGLVAVDPAGEGREQELEVEHGAHVPSDRPIASRRTTGYERATESSNSTRSAELRWVSTIGSSGGSGTNKTLHGRDASRAPVAQRAPPHHVAWAK
jgi:hypothetical protein